MHHNASQCGPITLRHPSQQNDTFMRPPRRLKPVAVCSHMIGLRDIFPVWCRARDHNALFSVESQSLDGRYQPTDVAMGIAPAVTAGGRKADLREASPIPTNGGTLAPSADGRAERSEGGFCGGDAVTEPALAAPSADSGERKTEIVRLGKTRSQLLIFF